MKRKSPLKKSGQSETAKTKVRIQALLRAIRLILDGGCVLAPFQGKNGIPYCNGYRVDGELVLQYDHLNSRAHNISFADPDLGVIVCKGHHGWKGFRDNNKKIYDELIKKIIGKKRTALWEKIERDTKAYPMGIYEWGKIELALKQTLAKLEK